MPWCGPGTPLPGAVAVAIPVGTPGLDHAGSVYRMDGVVSLPLRALRDTGLPSVAQALARIRAAAGGVMTTRLAGGRVYDPLNGIDGKVMDLWVRDGRIVAPPADGRADEVIDLAGKVVLPGGIDLHSHIGGGKVNIARMMLPEEHRAHVQPRHGHCRSGSGHYSPSTFTTGYAYARMGYTMAFEPAMLPANARQAHQEMADVPLLDKGAYVLLGNDDLFLRLVRDGAGPDAIRDYVAWTLHATQALAVKIVNPGGISAFKFNGRRLDLDQEGPFYGITPRTILTTLADALTSLGVPHPIHVHGCNLGVAGGDATTLATIAGMEGRPIHLTHLQFHSYGKEGKAGFSSGAAAIAELVNRSPNVSVDIGQVMFGQTVTASGDTMSQVRNARFASPKKWVAMDIECEAGCGVLPFRYRDGNLVNALQWCVGLELFLLIQDPWRIFLTTDHPNGAPFTTYPHLIRLLMDRSFRQDMLVDHPQGRPRPFQPRRHRPRIQPLRDRDPHPRRPRAHPGHPQDPRPSRPRCHGRRHRLRRPPRPRAHVRPPAPAPEGGPPGDARRRGAGAQPVRRHPRRAAGLRRRHQGPGRQVLRGLPRHAARHIRARRRRDRGWRTGVRRGAHLQWGGVASLMHLVQTSLRNRETVDSSLYTMPGDGCVVERNRPLPPA